MEKLFRQICKDLHWYDLQEVAEMADVSPATLYLWRNGKIESPRTCNLVAVAEVLGYTIEWKKG